MKIDENLKINRLIDVYGELLTSKQLDITTSYFYDNLTFSEIGDNFGISRQAVNDCINQSVKALENYEDKLKIIAKIDSAELQLLDISKQLQDDNLTQKIANIINDLRS
jgi:predicted DNA-binding protein YlxM (UPF0122 family)